MAEANLGSVTSENIKNCNKEFNSKSETTNNYELTKGSIENKNTTEKLSSNINQFSKTEIKQSDDEFSSKISENGK